MSTAFIGNAELFSTSYFAPCWHYQWELHHQNSKAELKEAMAQANAVREKETTAYAHADSLKVVKLIEVCILKDADLFLDFANFGVRFWDLCSLECYQTYSSIPVFICCLVCNVLISKNHSFLTFSFTFSSFSSALSDAVRAFSWRLSTGSFSHCQPTSANWRARPQRSPE